MSGVQRCFELAGVVPLGVFVVAHVGSYASALFGRTSFGVASRQNLALLALEALLVWIPLAFHAGYGLVRLASPLQPSSGDRSRELGLRVSGLALLAFLGAHLAWFAWPLWVGERAPEDVHGLLVAGLSATTLGLPLVALAHLAGLALVALHLGLGLARFAENWGLARARAARRGAAAVSILIFVVGAATVVGLATGSPLPRFLH